MCDAVADLVQDHADDWDILPASVVVECEDECEKTQIGAGSGAGMSCHRLKCWPEPFRAISDGDKTVRNPQGG